MVRSKFEKEKNQALSQHRVNTAFQQHSNPHELINSFNLHTPPPYRERAVYVLLPRRWPIRRGGLPTPYGPPTHAIPTIPSLSLTPPTNPRLTPAIQLLSIPIGPCRFLTDTARPSLLTHPRGHGRVPSTQGTRRKLITKTKLAQFERAIFFSYYN